jgi:hypothetical protein
MYFSIEDATAAEVKGEKRNDRAPETTAIIIDITSTPKYFEAPFLAVFVRETFWLLKADPKAAYVHPSKKGIINIKTTTTTNRVMINPKIAPNVPKGNTGSATVPIKLIKVLNRTATINDEIKKSTKKGTSTFGLLTMHKIAFFIVVVTVMGFIVTVLFR